MENNIERIIKIVSIVATVSETVNLGKRRCWVREVNQCREEDGFFNKSFLQIKENDEEHFCKLTRMKVSSFNLLLSLLKGKLTKISHRKPIDAESRLAMTLIYLAHGCSTQMLAGSFKLGLSTVREIVYETCQVIYSELHETYMSTPNSCEWSKIASDFLCKTKLPNCVGAIDGKYIRIACPKRSEKILLCICDSNYLFRSYSIGAVGSKSEARVFVESEFGSKVFNETLDLPQSLPLPDAVTEFPYYFVGDAALPLKKNLMRPFPGRNLSQDKINFNNRVLKAHEFIENAFGILSNRWKILQTTIYCKPESFDKIVSAVILLHNFLMLQKDELYYNEKMVDREINGVFVPGSWRQDQTQLRNAASHFFNNTTKTAFNLRDKLKDYLFKH